MYDNGLYYNVGRQNKDGFDIHGQPWVDTAANMGQMAGTGLMFVNPMLGAGVLAASTIGKKVVDAVRRPGQIARGREIINSGSRRAVQDIQNNPYASFRGMDDNFSHQMQTQNKLFERQMYNLQAQEQSYRNQQHSSAVNAGLSKGSAMARELLMQNKNAMTTNNMMQNFALQQQAQKEQFEMQKWNMYPELRRRQKETAFDAFGGKVDPGTFNRVSGDIMRKVGY